MPSSMGRARGSGTLAGGSSTHASPCRREELARRHRAEVEPFGTTGGREGWRWCLAAVGEELRPAEGAGGDGAAGESRRRRSVRAGEWGRRSSRVFLDNIRWSSPPLGSSSEDKKKRTPKKLRRKE
jgi:hypothetical protein